jgi:hypothetical protein
MSSRVFREEAAPASAIAAPLWYFGMRYPSTRVVVTGTQKVAPGRATMRVSP